MNYVDVCDRLHGSYEAIEGGHAKDALVDLTGGLAEVYEINDDTKTEIYRHIQRAAFNGAFIACSKKVKSRICAAL